MTSCVLSSCFESSHIHHRYCKNRPSIMFFTCWTSWHHEGVFWSLVGIHVTVKAKWNGLHTYKTSMNFLMMKMNSPMKRPAYCFYTHFTNPHNVGVVVCHPLACIQLTSSVISLNLLSIILIKNLLTKSYWNNRRLHKNRLWIFGTTFVYCNLKFRKVRWNSSISWTDLNISLPNLSIPRRSWS